MDSSQPQLCLDLSIASLEIQAFIIEERDVAFIEREALGDDVPHPTDSSGRQRPGKGLGDHFNFPELAE